MENTSNLKIIYEDSDIIVIHKPSGLATQTGNVGSKDVISELKRYLFQQQSKKMEPYVGLVHRLDQPVEGLLVIAKNPKAAKEMSRQLLDGTLNKDYCALVYGIPEDEGTWINWLKHDKKNNRSDVIVREIRDAKKAELNYKVLEKKDNYCRVQIKLTTGRHHQIRVQFAANGHPLLGDNKYGNPESKELSVKLKIPAVALCANKIAFKHPTLNKTLQFEIVPRQF